MNSINVPLRPNDGVYLTGGNMKHLNKWFSLLILFLGLSANASSRLQSGYYVAVPAGGCDAIISNSSPSSFTMEFPDCSGMTIYEHFNCRSGVCASQEDGSLEAVIKGAKKFDVTNAAGVPISYEWQRSAE